MTATKTRKTTEIQSAAIYRCTDKETKEVSYLVKSDSEDMYYRLTWTGSYWSCPCPATKPCKHQRAVNEVLAARYAAEKEARDTTAYEKRVAELAAKESARPAWMNEADAYVESLVAKTEADANLQAQWGSPVYDEAHYTAKFARADAMNAAYNRHLTPIQCKDGLYVPEDAPTFEKMDRAAYDAVFDPCGLAFL